MVAAAQICVDVYGDNFVIKGQFANTHCVYHAIKLYSFLRVCKKACVRRKSSTNILIQ